MSSNLHTRRISTISVWQLVIYTLKKISQYSCLTNILKIPIFLSDKYQFPHFRIPNIPQSDSLQCTHFRILRLLKLTINGFDIEGETQLPTLLIFIVWCIYKTQEESNAWCIQPLNTAMAHFLFTLFKFLMFCRILYSESRTLKTLQNSKISRQLPSSMENKFTQRHMLVITNLSLVRKKNCHQARNCL